jgi:Recombinase
MVLADAGHGVYVVIDDQGRQTMASCGGLTILIVEDLLIAAMQLGLLAPERLRRAGVRPYGYRLADVGPHPNKAHAAGGRRAHRLEPDPATAPVVRWMFAQRLAGHSVARITRALNDAGIPCPSAADPSATRTARDSHGR